MMLIYIDRWHANDLTVSPRWLAVAASRSPHCR
jgi:hypothetical protein